MYHRSCIPKDYYFKNEDNLKHEYNLKTKDDLITEVDIKKEDNLKNEDYLKKEDKFFLFFNHNASHYWQYMSLTFIVSKVICGLPTMTIVTDKICH